MVGKRELTTAQAFGLVLRRQRNERGLSQEALALEAGIQRNYVSLIELGKNQPTVTIVFKLASALSIKPARLVQLVDEAIHNKPQSESSRDGPRSEP